MAVLCAPLTLMVLYLKLNGVSAAAATDSRTSNNTTLPRFERSARIEFSLPKVFDPENCGRQSPPHHCLLLEGKNHFAPTRLISHEASNEGSRNLGVRNYISIQAPVNRVHRP